jgi:hypothetical protein
MSVGELIHHPADHPPQESGFHRLIGATESRQRRPSSCLPTGLMPQASRGVRGADEIYLARPTVPHPHLLLAVPIQRCGAGPTPIPQYHAQPVRPPLKSSGLSCSAVDDISQARRPANWAQTRPPNRLHRLRRRRCRLLPDFLSHGSIGDGGSTMHTWARLV